MCCRYGLFGLVVLLALLSFAGMLGSVFMYSRGYATVESISLGIGAPSAVVLTRTERCAQLVFFPQKSMKTNNRMLAVIGMADSIQGLAGDVVEAGVAGGQTSLRLLFFLACTGDLETRTFHFFDTWTGLPHSSSKADGAFRPGMWGITFEEFTRNAAEMQGLYKAKIGPVDDRGLPQRAPSWDTVWQKHVRIHRGRFEDTMSKALEGRQVALLMCDGDMYISSMQCLEAAEPKVTPGGWIYQDDYFTFEASYQAVVDYRKRNRVAAPLFLVPERGDSTLIQEDMLLCKPPSDRDKSHGSCNGRQIGAGIWQKNGE